MRSRQRPPIPRKTPSPNVGAITDRPKTPPKHTDNPSSLNVGAITDRPQHAPEYHPATGISHPNPTTGISPPAMWFCGGKTPGRTMCAPTCRNAPSANVGAITDRPKTPSNERRPPIHRKRPVPKYTAVSRPLCPHYTPPFPLCRRVFVAHHRKQSSNIFSALSLRLYTVDLSISNISQISSATRGTGSM